MNLTTHTLWLFAGIGIVLLIASTVGFILKKRIKGQPNAVIDNLNARINAWWVMALLIGLAFCFGHLGVILLFYCVSFYALREFITLTPTRRSDYPALVAAFYFALPMPGFIGRRYYALSGARRQSAMGFNDCGVLYFLGTGIIDFKN